MDLTWFEGKKTYLTAIATQWWNKNADILFIQKQLGHSSIVTTVQCIQMLPARIKSTAEHYAPAYL